jgi:predicted membrane channel-forming protein YqfA (hemolysin III family)
MKYYNKVFDVFLYQSIFILLFGAFLHILNDPISPTLFLVAIVTAGIAVALGCIGYFFQLFKKERKEY